MARQTYSDGSQGSHRSLRVGEAIRRRLSELLSRGEIHDPVLSGASITVGEVRVTSDLRLATAYVLPLGGENADGVLEALRRNKGELRHHVGKALQIKHTPDLKFELDDTFDRMDATRKLFSDERIQSDVNAPDSEED